MPNNQRKRTRALNFKPGNVRITNSDDPFSGCSKFNVIDHIAKSYMITVDDHRAFINNKLDCFYNRVLNLPENIISDVYLKVKAIESELKMTLPEVAVEIRRVLGDISFFREDGSPLPSDNILKAMKAIQAKFSPKLVKTYLYS